MHGVISSAGFGNSGIDQTSLIEDWNPDILSASAGGVALASWTSFVSGGHALTGTGSAQPLCKTGGPNGHYRVLFDGINDSMAATFTLNQAFTIVLVYKQVSLHAAGDHNIVFDGKTSDCFLYTDSSKEVALEAPSAIFRLGQVPADGVYETVVCVCNTTTSKINSARVDLATGNIGTNNPGGFTLGSNRAGVSATNIDVLRGLIYSGIPGVNFNLTKTQNALSSLYNVT